MPRIMKKWLALLIAVFVIVSLLLYWQFNYPDNETIEREFLLQNPNVEYVSAEMIFDWEPKRSATYIVKYKRPPNDEVRLSDFSIQQHWYFRWRWCSDQTERKCD